MGTTEKGLGQEASGEVSENGDEERIVKAEAASLFARLAPSSLPDPTCHSITLTQEQTYF